MYTNVDRAYIVKPKATCQITRQANKQASMHALTYLEHATSMHAPI